MQRSTKFGTNAATAFGLVLLSALLASCSAPAPEAPQVAVSERGAQACVHAEAIGSLRISDTDPHTLYYGAGKTVWINQLSKSCRFRSGDILVTKPDVASYCRGDLVRSLDPFSHLPGASCVLGDFIPYNR